LTAKSEINQSKLIDTCWWARVSSFCLPAQRGQLVQFGRRPLRLQWNQLEHNRHPDNGVGGSSLARPARRADNDSSSSNNNRMVLERRRCAARKKGRNKQRAVNAGGRASERGANAESYEGEQSRARARDLRQNQITLER